MVEGWGGVGARGRGVGVPVGDVVGVTLWVWGVRWVEWWCGVGEERRECGSGKCGLGLQLGGGVGVG